MPRDRLLTNTIIDTTRSAGPRRNRNQRRGHVDTWWPLLVAPVALALVYFAARML